MSRKKNSVTGVPDPERHCEAVTSSGPGMRAGTPVSGPERRAQKGPGLCGPFLGDKERTTSHWRKDRLCGDRCWGHGTDTGKRRQAGRVPEQPQKGPTTPG